MVPNCGSSHSFLHVALRALASEVGASSASQDDPNLKEGRPRLAPVWSPFPLPFRLQNYPQVDA